MQLKRLFAALLLLIALEQASSKTSAANEPADLDAGEPTESKRQLAGFAADSAKLGRLIVLDPINGRQVSVLPGFLEETLLRRGSFQFGAGLVVFNKLKVLGNVYARRINGRPLRESYLIGGKRHQQQRQYQQQQQQQQQQSNQQRQAQEPKTITLKLY